MQPWMISSQNAYTNFIIGFRKTQPLMVSSQIPQTNFNIGFRKTTRVDTTGNHKQLCRVFKLVLQDHPYDFYKFISQTLSITHRVVFRVVLL